MSSHNQSSISENDIIALLNNSLKYSNNASLLCKLDPKNINFLRIIECNDEFLQCFDFDRLDVIGQSYDFLLQKDDMDYASIGYFQYVSLIKSAKARQPADINIKISYATKLGEFDYFRVTLLPIKSKIRNTYCILNFRKLPKTDDQNLISPALIQNLERALRNERILRVVSDIISSEPDLREVFIRTSEIIYQHLKVDRCMIYKFYDAGSSFIIESCGDDYEKISDKYDYQDKQSIISQYIDFQYKIFTDSCFSKYKNHTIVNNDISDSKQFELIEDIFGEFKIGSQIVITMVTGGNIVGALYIHQSSGRYWSMGEIELIEIIADELAVAIDRDNYVKNLLISNRGLIESSRNLSIELRQEREMRELQNEFVTLVSHEFKTPLQIIDGSRELIARKTKSLNITEECIEKPLERIKNAVIRMNSLIQDNLNLSKIGAVETKIEVNKQDFDIEQLIKDVVEKSSNLVNNRMIDIEVDIKNLPNLYNGDQQLIEHSLTNIIGNAIKYSHNNSVVTVSADLKDGQLFFEVKDNGIGIPKEDIRKIGRKFFRATNTSTIAGTGIGLYLTKYFIELHNGSFSLESELNVGTTIQVLLPMTTPI